MIEATEFNMRAKASHGEDAPVDDSGNIEEVQRRLEEIQQRKRGGMRWGMSRRTAEMAMVAIDDIDPSATQPARKSGKGRRRKRHKRLL
jgi:hypothetical protein